MAEQTARDAKLVQFLSEAYQKEAELEADLTAHITLTAKKPYRQRLEQHLKETRDHKRRVASRIKQLGGPPPAAGVQLPGVPGAAGELVGKGVAAVKGQVGAARALVTEQAETHLRNAREELREEHVEIALYATIQALAEQVGDRDTVRLAKDIARDEQKMANYLERQIPSLVGDMVRAEIPRDQRAGGGRRGSSRRKSSARKSSARKSSSRSSAGRKSAAKKSSGAKKSSARKSGGAKKSSSAKKSSGAKKRSAARKSSGAKKRSTARKKSGAKKR